MAVSWLTFGLPVPAGVSEAAALGLGGAPQTSVSQLAMLLWLLVLGWLLVGGLLSSVVLLRPPAKGSPGVTGTHAAGPRGRGSVSSSRQGCTVFQGAVLLYLPAPSPERPAVSSLSAPPAPTAATLDFSCP